MKTIVVTRKYWGKAMLRRTDGKKCCLGFVCEAYGVSVKNTLNIDMPGGLVKGKSKIPRWMYSSLPGADAYEASIINDHPTMSRNNKEKALKPIFARHGIRLVFRGKR